MEVHTHRDDIDVSVIHFFVILISPFQANCCPGLQIEVGSSVSFPGSHEYFKQRNCTRQDGGQMRRHYLVDIMGCLVTIFVRNTLNLKKKSSYLKNCEQSIQNIPVIIIEFEVWEVCP